MVPTIALSISLALLWLMNSGHYTPLLLAMGALSVGFVVWVARRMGVVDSESQPLAILVRVPPYHLWLLGQLIRANIDVLKRIWGVSGQGIAPLVETLPLSQHSDIGKVIYANSITLTPGTVAINLEDDRVTVHALSPEQIDDLRQGDMDRRVSRLESP